MPSNHGALVVFGSGPGIGRNVASYFAEQGFNEVYLLSRDQSRLQEDVAFVKKAAPEATCEAIEVDLADGHTVKSALKDLEAKLQGRPLECVLYNAARVGTSQLSEWSDEEYERDLRVSSFTNNRRLY
jgi:NAD(P)-dependent dehydrogenase (short-subunit alcohol dehydrogenase family)